MPRAITVALLLAVPALATAQSVSGVVNDRSTSEPLPGVVVLLLDANGVTVGRALSNERGEYRVAALRPGAHRMRALRIGFLPVTTQPFTLAAGAQLNRPFVLAGIPVALDTFRVTSRGRCDVRPDSAMATYRVWEQVRTALAATEITGGARTVRARVLMYVRTLDRRGRDLISQTTRVREGDTQRAWVARSQDSLRRFGYVHANPDGSTTFYAPDLPVLLSDDFLEDHCVRISNASNASRLGIEFRPTRARRGIPEIRGIVWLDRKSAELRDMQFGYVNTPNEFDAGGEMRFVRMRNSAWMISGWHIRMPVIETRRVVRATDGLPETKSSVREMRVEGGDLVLVTRGGDTLWSQHPLVLRGRVVDAESGAPVAAARIRVRGTPLSERSDSIGRFSFRSLVAGEYTLEIASPELEASRFSRRVTVRLLDDSARVTVRVPRPPQTPP